MAKAAQPVHALASGAGDAHRSLERRIAQVDSAWSDSARRKFEADHLASIRSDARHLSDALAEIAADLDRATRAVDRT
jgi:uncharacterized protein YukE